AGTVRADDADAIATLKDIAGPFDQPATAVGLRHAVELQNPAAESPPADRAIEFLAGLLLRDRHQRPGPVDARLLLGGTRARAPLQPLQFLADQRLALALLARTPRLVLLLLLQIVRIASGETGNAPAIDLDDPAGHA